MRSPEDIIAFVTALPGVAVVIAGEENGAPRAAWGDAFFFYDPDGDDPRRMPFATIVTQDYEGSDTASRLDRPGVFRLNVGVGRDAFEKLIGYPPAEHAARSAEHDHSALDTLLPNPVYAVQGWVSILCPGERTTATARELLTGAYERAVVRRNARGPHPAG